MRSPSREGRAGSCALTRAPKPQPPHTLTQAFKDKSWQLCYDLASESIRLNPRKKEYLGNRAAAGLRLKTKRHLRQAAEDSVNAYEMDKFYVKAYMRAAEAHMLLNERVSRHGARRTCDRRDSCFALGWELAPRCHCPSSACRVHLVSARS